MFAQVKQFLNKELQSAILAKAEELGWFDDPKRQNQVDYSWVLHAYHLARPENYLLAGLCVVALPYMQAMHFGELPVWLLKTIEIAHMHAYLKEAWPNEIAGRHPMFDQFIMNLYEPGDGIGSHVDLLRFQVHRATSDVP